MRQRSLGWALLTVALTGCSANSPGDGSEVADTPALTEMLVLRASGRLGPGRTVSVDLADISQDNRVAYYVRGARSGTVSLDVLGPSAGTMVVAADRLNVRRCRSKGCSVVGYVSRGQRVEVRDYADLWYRAKIDGEEMGYIFAEHLRMPLAIQGGMLAEMERRTAAYYDGTLKATSVDGYGSVFSGYDLKLEDGMLSFEFYTPFKEGPPLVAICDAMRGIASFVSGLIANAPSAAVPAHFAGVYLDSAETSGDDGDAVMVAGLAAEDDVYCRAE
jgi:hypothetical protein